MGCAPVIHPYRKSIFSALSAHVARNLPDRCNKVHLQHASFSVNRIYFIYQGYSVLWLRLGCAKAKEQLSQNSRLIIRFNFILVYQETYKWNLKSSEVLRVRLVGLMRYLEQIQKHAENDVVKLKKPLLLETKAKNANSFYNLHIPRSFIPR